MSIHSIHPEATNPPEQIHTNILQTTHCEPETCNQDIQLSNYHEDNTRWLMQFCNTEMIVYISTQDISPEKSVPHIEGNDDNFCPTLEYWIIVCAVPCPESPECIPYYYNYYNLLYCMARTYNRVIVCRPIFTLLVVECVVMTCWSLVLGYLSFVRVFICPPPLSTMHTITVLWNNIIRVYIRKLYWLENGCCKHACAAIR